MLGFPYRSNGGFCRFRSFLAVGILLSLLCSGALSGQTVFRSQKNTVVAHAIVRDVRTGALIAGLSRDDFTLHVDGRPLEITDFSAEHQPLSVVVMVDTSASMWPHLVAVRMASLAFAEALEDGDQVSIGSFSSFSVALNPLWSRNRDVLGRVLTEELWPGPNSPVWAAISRAVGGLATMEGRRVVLMFSDGKDRGNVPGFPGNRQDTYRDVMRTGTMVYLVSPFLADVSTDTRQFAIDTGGGHVALGSALDFTQPMRDLAVDLRSQYLVGFNAETDGREHQIALATRNRAWIVQSRRAYVAR